MPIPVLTPCKVSLALVSAFLAELAQVCCWFQDKTRSSLRTHSATEGREIYPSARWIPTIPAAPCPPHSLLAEPGFWHGIDTTCQRVWSAWSATNQGRCGSRIDPLSVCFPIPESSSRKETTPCKQQTRSSRSNQHVWVVLREISALLYGTLTLPLTQKQIKYFIPEF